MVQRVGQTDPLNQHLIQIHILYNAELRYSKCSLMLSVAICLYKYQAIIVGQSVDT